MRQLNHSGWLFEQKIEPLSEKWLNKARKRLNSLVKPKGSLGRLEDIAAKVVAITQNDRPEIEKKAVFVFAADHGVVEEGVSAYPQDVTKAMVENFLNGIAGINVLAKSVNADVYVVDVGVKGDIYRESPYFIKRKIRHGTENITKASAMSVEEALEAIKVGIEIADMAKDKGVKMIALGDMGIGNTTPSSALLCAFLKLSPEDAVGLGTGIDEAKLRKKIEVVKKALSKNRSIIEEGNPLKILAAIGGLEIAAICGACIGGVKNRILVLVDGFISCAGALAAIKINPTVKDYLFFSHISAEKGHKLFFDKIGESPILNLDMRLGEGTGAALAMHIVECAIRLYNEMATFEEVGIKPGHNI